MIRKKNRKFLIPFSLLFINFISITQDAEITDNKEIINNNPGNKAPITSDTLVKTYRKKRNNIKEENEIL